MTGLRTRFALIVREDAEKIGLADSLITESVRP